MPPPPKAEQPGLADRIIQFPGRAAEGYSDYVNRYTPEAAQRGSKRVMDALRGIKPVPRRTPPKDAVDQLKRDPSTLDQFERAFGLEKGEGRQYLLR